MHLTITHRDLTGLSVYRQGRSDYVNKMIAYKKNRRLQLAPYISILFENRDTVLFQIQELVNSEDLTDAGEINEYIDIYSGMLPANNELSATMFIEIDVQETLQDLLKKLTGIEHHLSMEVGGESIQAVFEEEHDDREFTTSVHYLKFPLTVAAKNYLIHTAAADVDLRLILSHPKYTSEVQVPAATVQSLQGDLS